MAAKTHVSAAIVLMVASFTQSAAPASAPKTDDAAQAIEAEWLGKVSTKHPRMFLTAESLADVRQYTLQHEKDYYEAMKRRVASRPEKADPATFEKGAQIKYGPYAQEAAFVWLMEKDAAALAKAKNYLQEGLKFYLRSSSAGKPVNWYSADRVCALTTYDWICDQLTPAERKEIALGFFQHYKEDMAGKGSVFNHGDYKTGFYGSPNLPWYIGLAFYKDGIDDEQAAALLKKGFEDHWRLLRYRAAASGDDGGAGSLAVGYAFGMYPFAEFNFFHTFDSATGLAIERAFPHPSLLGNWVYWMHLPGGYQCGLADSAPAGKLSDGSLEMAMLEIAHFWGREFPDRAGLAMWVREKLLASRQHDDYWWPLAPLFVTRCGELRGEGILPSRTAGVSPAPFSLENLPRARNFQDMGVVFMRSGQGPGDTCAAFVAGGAVNQHRHYDQGHFVIYRGGFLAIDSGDYGPRERNDHLCEYFYRTVAHNAVLIHAPSGADTPATIWGGPAKTLDGGQCEFAGRQVAFETNAAYSYAATDVTKCYAPAKCKEAVRQFVFVYPDTFVICDRVTSARPEYAKRWLLHTVNEPALGADGRSFRVEQGDGALVCRTVLPREAALEKVGGPGKEFWSAGANHPQETASRDGKPAAHKELSGAWRIEVAPKTASAADVFVHVIRVGDKSLKDAPLADAGRTASASAAADKSAAFEKVEAVEDAAKGLASVRLKTAQGELTVTFRTSGEVGGHITLSGPAKIDQDLTKNLQPQSGLGGAK